MKNYYYYFLITIPIILMSLHLEIAFANITDLIVLFYFFILVYFISKQKKIIVSRNNNKYIYIFIFWLLILTTRGIILNFINEESILGNKLVREYIGYIDDRSDFLNFFRVGEVQTHFLTYFRFILAFLVCYIGFFMANKFKVPLYYIKFGLLFSLVINVFISIIQVLQGAYRANGIFGHAQDLSSLALMYISLELVNKGKKSKLGLLIALVAIWLSGTRSAYFAVIILLISYILKNNKIAIFTIGGTFFSTMLIAMSFTFKQFILNVFSLITDPWDLMIRFELWSKVFYQVSLKNYIFGANVFPSFTDNIIWFMVMPTGYIGLIIFLALFVREAKLSMLSGNQYKLNFIIILFGQGLLFNGFLGEYTIFLWFFIYGLLYKVNIMNK
jgi:hypothetical protein